MPARDRLRGGGLSFRPRGRERGRSQAEGGRQPPGRRKQRSGVRSARGELAELRVRLRERLRLLEHARSGHASRRPGRGRRRGDRALAHQRRAAAAQPGLLARRGRPAGFRQAGRLPRRGAALGRAAARGRDRGDPRPALERPGGGSRRRAARHGRRTLRRLLALGRPHVQPRPLGDLRRLQRAVLGSRPARPELGVLARRRLPGAGGRRARQRHVHDRRHADARRRGPLDRSAAADHPDRARLRQRPGRLGGQPAGGRGAARRLPQLRHLAVQGAELLGRARSRRSRNRSRS